MFCLNLLQQCMAKRFDGSQQALDLNNIRTDPGYYTIKHTLTLSMTSTIHTKLAPTTKYMVVALPTLQ